jgi:hypothetical protein
MDQSSYVWLCPLEIRHPPPPAAYQIILMLNPAINQTTLMCSVKKLHPTHYTFKLLLK